jgi:hypothetical protein
MILTNPRAAIAVTRHASNAGGTSHIDRSYCRQASAIPPGQGHGCVLLLGVLVIGGRAFTGSEMTGLSPKCDGKPGA